MDFLKENRKIHGLVEKHKYEKAITILEQQIEKHKDVGKSFLILCEIYEIQKEYDSLLSNLETSLFYVTYIEKDLLLEIYRRLGDIYLKKEDLKRAFNVYKKGLDIDSKNPPILYQIILLYMKVRKFKQAAGIFKMLGSLQKERQFQALMGHYYCVTGNYDKSRAILEKLVHENPSYALGGFYLGLHYFKLKEYESAKDVFESIKSDKELRCESLYYLGKMDFENQNYRHASESFEAAVRAVSFDNRLTLDLYYCLAICYENFKDFNKSLDQLRSAYHIDPEYKDIADKLISEHYKDLNKNYLLDYDAYSPAEFKKFGERFLKKVNVKAVKNTLTKNNNMLVFQGKAAKMGSVPPVFKNIFHVDRNEVVLVAFLRSMLVRENTIQEVIESNKFKFKKGIILSSQNVSVLAIKYAARFNIKVIIPTFLNGIIEKMK